MRLSNWLCILVWMIVDVLLSIAGARMINALSQVKFSKLQGLFRYQEDTEDIVKRMLHTDLYYVGLVS